MKKVLLSVILLIVCSLAANAQKFALIDTEYIFKNIPAYEQANTQLSEFGKKWQAEVEASTKEAQALYKNYQAKAASLTAAQKTQQEEAIVAKEKATGELKRKYFGPDGEMAKKQKELIQPLQDKIYAAVKALSEARGYNVVVDRASAQSILFASPSIDISNDVLARLGYSN